MQLIRILVNYFQNLSFLVFIQANYPEYVLQFLAIIENIG
jgi:hypothetical protein